MRFTRNGRARGVARWTGVAAVPVAGIMAMVSGPLAPVGANHQPANKVAVAGSATEIAGPATDVTLMTGTLKTSSPTDVLIQLSMECALFTDTSVAPARQKSTAVATARVESWIEIDATPADATDDANNVVVPVASNDTAAAPGDISLDNDVPPQAAAGRVVMCHRTQGLEAALDFSDAGILASDDFIRLYQGTREASAFNWVRLNMGSGTFEIEVHAQVVDEISSTNGGVAVAKGAIGKRTLIVEPAKLANDATI